MKSLLLITSCLFVADSWAATLRAPLLKSRQASSISAPESLRRRDPPQQPLKLPTEEHGHPVEVLMNVTYPFPMPPSITPTTPYSTYMTTLQSFLPIYTTNITIGTPPQPFSIAIDLIASTLFVPSASCSYNVCDEGYQRYNASFSSTYVANGSYIGAHWAGVSYTGHVSRDTLHISDLSLSSTLFEEWTNANCMHVGCIRGGSQVGGYDGVLPLSPPWKPSQLPTPLSLLLSQNLLSSPIFSLKLPRSQSDTGELLLGGTNPSLHTTPPITIPITNATLPLQRPFADLWTVKPTHITFNTATTTLFHQALSKDFTAVLDAANPWLILPSRLARNLTAAIGAQPGPYWFHNIPCSSRAYLPTLTFGLAGHNFTIDAFDYTHEVDYPHVGLICITTFWAAEGFGMENSETLLLGSAFLKGFYGVFDMDRREVGCEYSLRAAFIHFRDQANEV